MKRKGEQGEVTEIGSEDSASKNSRNVSWLDMDFADTVLPCGLPSPLVTKAHAFLNSNCGGLERFSLWRYWGKNDARVLLWTRSVYCLTHAGMVRHHLSD